MQDRYTDDILRARFDDYKKSYVSVQEWKALGIPIRQQNPPEDITENLTKFIIRNYENDKTCIWCKGSKLYGDLYSDKYTKQAPIEVKSFTSNGPAQFGPNKKFSVLYFLDLRDWLNDVIILWRIDLTNESPEFKNIRMNKTQTHQEQCNEGRRPHISWDKLYPQIESHCTKVYEGTFEDIFLSQ